MILEWLRKRLNRGIAKVMDYPSILKQTRWNAGFFHFGKAQADPRIRFFNPSLVNHAGFDWLVSRRAEDFDNSPFGMNTIWAFKLDQFHRPLQGIKVDFKGRYKGQHYEDPRITMMPNGKLWLSYTTFVIDTAKGWYGAHQGCASLSEVFQPQATFDPVYGANGGSVMMNRGSEKNWLWFFHDGVPHMIYHTDPVHEVVRFNSSLGVVRKYETSEHKGTFAKWGQPRGGTPPVLVGDEYWSFFHSSVPWNKKKRRYFMGAYAFEAKAPFRITRMTRRPILSGSKNDPWSETQPLVVFPCGALLRNDEWFVSMGINDMASAWIEIPHNELCTLTIPINETVQVVQTKPAPAQAPVQPQPPVQPNIATMEAGFHLNGVVVSTVVSTTDAGTLCDFERQLPVPDKPARRSVKRRRGKSLRSGERVSTGVAPVAGDDGAH